MRHWLKKLKPVQEPEAKDQTIEVFDQVFNPDNDAPVRVRTVKEFVVELIERSHEKDTLIEKLETEKEGLEAKVEELDVARLALEEADVVRKKLEDRIDQLKAKLDEQKKKNQELRDTNNDLELKLVLKRKTVKRSKKENNGKAIR